MFVFRDDFEQKACVLRTRRLFSACEHGSGRYPALAKGQVMNDLPADTLLVQALAELETAKVRVRDLEGFVRVYTELRRSGVATPTQNAPAALVSAHRLESRLEPLDGLQQDAATAMAPTRPGVVLADPDLSITDAAVKVLRYFGQPMKARGIAETMLAWGFPYPKGVDDLRASVGGVLARAVREGNEFTKLATGLFGLAEWGTGDGDGAAHENAGEEQSLFFGPGMVEMD
jgi:hypothetical protein